MKTFQKRPLGELTKIVRGISYSSAELSTAEQGRPFINLRNVDKGGGFRPDGLKYYSGKFKPAQLVIPGDLLIANTDLSKSKDVLGSPIIIPSTPTIEDAVFSLDLTKLIPNDSIVLKKYLAFFLESNEARKFMKENGSGTTVMHLQLGALPKLLVPTPPLSEQHKIVEVLADHLSRLDAALADVRQAKEKAAQFRRSLLQAAFTGNLTSDGTHIVNKLPREWEVKTLGEVAKWGSGGTPRAGTKSFYDGDIPWAIIGDLNDTYVTETARTITQKGLEESSAKLVPVGAVLIAMYGSIGKLGINTIPMATNQAIAFAIPNTEIILQKYLFYFLSSQRDIFLWRGKGATQQNISQTLLKAWNIPLPPLPEQHKIVEVLEDHLSRLDASVALADSMEKQSATLRRALLQAAFTGQLTKEVASV